ncbi:MAG: hemerythrin domain-containing protein [Pseudonocardia sp.]|nr:hemerythrin domain-containing protein [Pseudonocardia sp.]
MAEQGDILAQILDDHTWFRRQFLRLDELRADDAAPAELAAVWTPLAARLDVHAAAEEQVFYPELLRRGADDPAAETLDAIGDHNDIRDGVRDARAANVGDDAWWAGVRAAREANDEHMAEEEREGIADFRVHAPPRLRRSLGERFAAFLAEHRTSDELDTADVDPDEYVAEVEAEIETERQDDLADAGSLRIGSLKGQR